MRPVAPVSKGSRGPLPLTWTHVPETPWIRFRTPDGAHPARHLPTPQPGPSALWKLRYPDSRRATPAVPAPKHPQAVPNLPRDLLSAFSVAIPDPPTPTPADTSSTSLALAEDPRPSA